MRPVSGVEWRSFEGRPCFLNGRTFADEDSARKAKQSLNGADVYSGCCTLKIEYARVGT